MVAATALTVTVVVALAGEPAKALAAGLILLTIVFALMLGGARFRDAVKLMLPLLLISALVLIPLTYLWWRFLGYLG